MMNEDRYLFHKERDAYDEGNSLTVSQLIGILQRYPKEMKVIVTWESTVHGLEEINIYEAYTGSLYIDADANFYKEEYEKKT